MGVGPGKVVCHTAPPQVRYRGIAWALGQGRGLHCSRRCGTGRGVAWALEQGQGRGYAALLPAGAAQGRGMAWAVGRGRGVRCFLQCGVREAGRQFRKVEHLRHDMGTGVWESARGGDVSHCLLQL